MPFALPRLTPSRVPGKSDILRPSHRGTFPVRLALTGIAAGSVPIPCGRLSIPVSAPGQRLRSAWRSSVPCRRDGRPLTSHSRGNGCTRISLTATRQSRHPRTWPSVPPSFHFCPLCFAALLLLRSNLHCAPSSAHTERSPLQSLQYCVSGAVCGGREPSGCLLRFILT